MMTDKEIEVIVKPIFTKMFKANFSACEYGIECYKKGMEYQGIKELAIENDNLIKRVGKLEAQIEQMKCCYNCKHSRTEEELEDEICEYVHSHYKVAALGFSYRDLRDVAEHFALPKEKRIEELEAQIEQMKCCYNCKHSRTEYEHCRTNKHEKWEIKEK